MWVLNNTIGIVGKSSRKGEFCQYFYVERVPEFDGCRQYSEGERRHLAGRKERQAAAHDSNAAQWGKYSIRNGSRLES